MRRALVIGRAAGVWEEVARAESLGAFDMVLLVGRAGTNYPGRIDRWVSWHADLFLRWSEERKRLGHPPAGGYWSGQHLGKRIPRGRVLPPVPVTYIKSPGGSSGFLAIDVAFADPKPADIVVLAGIPMDPDRQHWDQQGAWRDALTFRKVWEAEVGRLKGRVKSMSGWTAALLGEPTAEWLNGISGTTSSRATA